MIKPGDYVVVVNNIVKEYGLITQLVDKIKDGKATILINGERCLVELNCIQRIQDYFEPGDRIAIYEKDVNMHYEATVQKMDGKSLLFTEETRGIWGLELDVWRGRIRNLTKESKMNKEKPTILTVKDLVDKDAWDLLFKGFVAKFSKGVTLNYPVFKEWLESNESYKSWFQNNLPDHYAVIFGWQPQINEIVWVCGEELQWIGRILENVEGGNGFYIMDQSSDKYPIAAQAIKPLSERPFQVGDWVKHKGTCSALEVIKNISDWGSEQIYEANANKYKNDFDLIISPAIPEVK